MGFEADAHGSAGGNDALHVVLGVLGQTERQLARAVAAARAGNRARLLEELMVLACLVHIGSQLAAPRDRDRDD